VPAVHAARATADRADHDTGRGHPLAASALEHWMPIADDLVDTTEMYLKTIYELVEDGITPLRARIAERLGHSGPTVSQTVARMERDGLVVLDDERHLRLTDTGLARATRVMRKHRLAERLLVDVVGLGWPFAHEEACRWEHVMSERVERRLVDLLAHPRTDPYGNPIPGLAEIGDAGPSAARPAGETSLLQAAQDATPPPAGWTVARIGEPLQTDTDLLALFARAGLRPGAAVAIAAGQPVVTVAATGRDTVLEMPDEVARHVFVFVAC
jgi:DtxR family Mn-dependent transcriptional regulator